MGIFYAFFNIVSDVTLFLCKNGLGTGRGKSTQTRKRLGGAPGYETTARRPREKKTFVNGVENGQGAYILKQYPCRLALEGIVAACFIRRHQSGIVEHRVLTLAFSFEGKIDFLIHFHIEMVHCRTIALTH